MLRSQISHDLWSLVPHSHSYLLPKELMASSSSPLWSLSVEVIISPPPSASALLEFSSDLLSWRPCSLACRTRVNKEMEYQVWLHLPIACLPDTQGSSEPQGKVQTGVCATSVYARHCPGERHLCHRCVAWDPEITVGSLAERNDMGVLWQMPGNTGINANRPFLPPFSLHLGCLSPITLSSDLSHLVAEIRALRGQLEQSIQGNNCLRLQLEQQLDGGSRKASLSLSSVNQNFPANTDSGSKQPLFQGRKEKGIRKPSASGEVPRMSVMEGTVLLLPHSLRSRWNQRCLRIVPRVRAQDLGADLAPDSEFATWAKCLISSGI